MSVDFECIVVGAGVVGLAVARALAMAGREVLVVERHGVAGSEMSSRNSGVIHAGLYYPPGSAKAQLCVAGRKLLYEFAADNGVAHREVGKLVVATERGQVGTLEDIRIMASQNGVDDLRLLNPRDVAQLEPELMCEAALLSPSTGIIDVHELVVALQGHCEAGGVSFSFRTPVKSIAARSGGGFLLSCGEGGADRVTCRCLVVAAGLSGSQLMETLNSGSCGNGYVPPRTYFAKGNYFAAAGKSPFKHLIYPVPEPGGLGIHLTVDLAGRARFGPDVEWLETRDPAELSYGVDPWRAGSFYRAVSKYWPGLREGALVADFAGIRAKIVGLGEVAGDFAIHDESVHGIAGLVALFGIESPGLTSALAFGELVRDRLDAHSG